MFRAPGRILLAIWMIGIMENSGSFAGKEAVRVFRVEEYGAVADGATDAGPAIRRAIQAAAAFGERAEVRLGPGRYRVRAEGNARICFPVVRAKNLTIRGVPGHTEILIADLRDSGFNGAECDGLFIKDLTIDYETPPFTQGTIRAAAPEEGAFDLDIEPGFPLPSTPGFAESPEPFGKWGMIFDPKRRALKTGAPDHVFIKSWSPVRDRIWRFQVAAGENGKLRYMQSGDRFVHMARGGFAAVGFTWSRNSGVENVTVHASPGGAMVLLGCENISVRGLRVRFRPGTHRLLTTDADGVHCQQNRIGPRIENCLFEGMADDAINIYAPPNIVLETRSPTQLVTTAGCRIRPGDRLQVMDPRAGIVRAEVTAAQVQPQGNRYALTLDRPVPDIRSGSSARDADTLYNLSASGEGYVIRSNVMRGHRRHGILLRAGKGLVEGNTLDGTAGFGVVVTNEPDWPEGPFAHDITIRRNRFRGGGYALGYGDSPLGAALTVRGIKLGFHRADQPAQRHIRIEENTFTDPPGAAILIGAARDVRIAANRITASESAPPRRRTAAILLESGEGLVLENNAVTDRRPDTLAAVEIGPGVASGDGGAAIRGLKAVLAPESRPVIDRRNQ
jgi:hypothetical protein